jgi:predicted PurR-regulated permease PerM
MSDTASPSDRQEPRSDPEPRSVTPALPALEAASDARLVAPLLGETVPVPLMMPRAIYPFGWSRGNLRRAIALTFAGLIAIVFLWQVQSILPPFLIAFLLAALLEPSLRYMEKRGRSRVYSILIFYLLALSIVAGVILFVVPLALQQVEDISHNLTRYSDNIQESANHFMTQYATQLKFVGIQQKNLKDLIQSKSGPFQAAVGSFLDFARSSVSFALSKALWFVIIPISSFFFMKDFPVLRARLIWLSPDRHQARVDLISREIMDIFSAYVRGLSKICALHALAAFIMFTLLGVNYAVFLGLLAGLFYAVPLVGNLITAASATAIAYLMPAHRALLFWNVPSNSLVYAAVIALSCILLSSFVFDQLVYPRVVGGSVGLHPVLSLFALAAGTTLFGVPGILLATPVAASIKLLLTYFFPKLAQSPPKRLLEKESPEAAANEAKDAADTQPSIQRYIVPE